MLIPSSTHGTGLLESETLSSVGGLVHGFTTRSLGDAGAPGQPGPDAIDRALGAEADRWTRHAVIQVHGARAVEAGSGEAVEADAVVSARRGDLLTIRTADCLSVLLVALEGDRPVAVAALHAGWRGLVGGILPSGVAALRGLRPASRVLGAIGPSIGPCCFEIGPEVAEPLERLGPGLVSPGRGDRSFADLPAAGRGVLAALGVETDDGVPPCTRCDPGRFHSYRGTGAAAGRMGAFIGLRP